MIQIEKSACEPGREGCSGLLDHHTSLPRALAPARAAQYKDRDRDNNTKQSANSNSAMTTQGDVRRGNILSFDLFTRSLPHGARLIGIDVGSKTLGLALSDVTRKIATGLVTLRRSKFTADSARLLGLAAEHGVGGFVVGLRSASRAPTARRRKPRAPLPATSRR